MNDGPLIRWFEELAAKDTPEVGGKNSSLGEMIRALSSAGVRVPGGFATTSTAYWRFLATDGLRDRIGGWIHEMHQGQATLSKTGARIREAIVATPLPHDLRAAVLQTYRQLSERTGHPEVAVRSSATAEDLPEASFAGQQESYLNVRGEDDLLNAVRRCIASLFTDRAIAYREAHGFDHDKVALSVGVQQMVRADEGSAGVAFTLDPDTGFPRFVLINAAWGLGESVVQGTLEPDQFRVFKPFLDGGGQPVLERICGKKQHKRIYGEGSTTVDVDTTPEERNRFALTDEEAIELSRWSVAIEQHYGKPMDIEWARDGRTGELFIVQARPETVHARQGQVLKRWELTGSGEVLLRGLAIGQAIASGPVRVVHDLSEVDDFEDGSILVTEMTDPDWVPVLKRAAAIVTDHGGRTSHAAIVARELGVPAVVGTGEATTVLKQADAITVDGSSGDEGRVYQGRVPFRTEEISLADLPSTRTRILMNVATPEAALRWWSLPVQGVGLARMEYLVNEVIGVHPMALAHFERVTDPSEQARIEALTRGYPDKPEYFVDRLARGLALMAAAQHPQPVVLRLSDFKTNEYAHLLGGQAFEPHEENPMLGWRGASRYVDEGYRDGFALECRAIRRVRSELGFRNLVVMVPFCRTPQEADRVLAEMARHGLRRGEDGLQIWVMAEIPSNILEAEAFAERFDGFSIGSNDLTQLTLGVDRDSEKLQDLFDERSPSVKWLIAELVRRAHPSGRTVSLCGQAPSDRPEYAAFLVEAGLDSISVNPDTVVQVIRHVAEAEAQRPDRAAGPGDPERRGFPSA